MFHVEQQKCGLTNIASASIMAVGAISLVKAHAFVLIGGALEPHVHMDFDTIPSGGYIDTHGGISIGTQVNAVFVQALQEVGSIKTHAAFEVASGKTGQRLQDAIGHCNVDLAGAVELGSAVEALGQATASNDQIGIVDGYRIRRVCMDMLEVVGHELGAGKLLFAFAVVTKASLQHWSQAASQLRKGAEPGTIDFLRERTRVCGTAVVDSQHGNATPATADSISKFVFNGAKIASVILCHNLRTFGVNNWVDFTWIRCLLEEPGSDYLPAVATFWTEKVGVISEPSRSYHGVIQA